MQFFNQVQAASPPWPVLYAPVFSAVAVLLVGAFAALIALRQWITAHTKLQLDLYDKRRPIFLAARGFIQGSDASPLDSDSWRENYRLARIDALFLFGSEVDIYMKDLWSEVDRRRLEEQTYRNSLDTPEILEARHQWKVQQLVRLEAFFAPYMTLTFRATRSSKGTKTNA